jgi:uracil-DNA glycosylase
MDTVWTKLIEEEAKKKYYKNLMLFLDSEYKTKTIYPRQEDIFRAFKLTPFKDVKIIIIGQDPYHGEHQANGLAFSVSKGNKIPPSLRNIFSLLLDDCGILPPPHGDLTEWAKQGVLLLNTILTVEQSAPLSHQKKGWEEFTDNVLKKLNEDDSPKVFMLWGNNAISKKNLLNNHFHLVIESSHPSPLSARHSFFTSACFSRANEFLIANKKSPVDFTITW